MTHFWKKYQRPRKKVKSERLETELDELKAIVDDKLKRTIDILQEKGAGSCRGGDFVNVPTRGINYIKHIPRYVQCSE